MPSLGSAVSSAIASATAVAASVASRDPTKSASYPLCAVRNSTPPSAHLTRNPRENTNTTHPQQKCQNASIPASGCGTVANYTCICKSPTLLKLDSSLNTCEVNTCSASDLQSISSPFRSSSHPTLQTQYNTNPLTHPLSHRTPRRQTLQPGRRHRQQRIQCNLHHRAQRPRTERFHRRRRSSDGGRSARLERAGADGSPGLASAVSEQ